MLIIPMTGKMSWRNPPVITILLILANFLVYFGIQSEDSKREWKADEYYVESGLAEIEISRFVEHMKAANPAQEISNPQGKKMSDPHVLAYLHQKMMTDSEFMKKLNKDEIITAKDSDYSKWKGLKKTYERMLSGVISWKYGYIPATGNMTTAFTYMFLHGSASHLIGNMIFLWLVGCTLELSERRAAYTLIYFLTGMASAVVFGLIYKNSVIPLVGASGAIAGIVGTFTVLYGRRKVKIFYSLGFYFNYIRIAAIFLLPVWIGNEFFQLFFSGIGNVAYVAHIAGLVCGAVLGFAQTKLLGGVKEEVSDADRAEKIALLIERGLKKFSELDLTSARALMNEVLEIDSNNCKAMTHLFNIEKLSPDSEEFHAIAVRLLLCLQREGNSDDALFDIYREYRSIAKHPKLSPDLWFRLSSAFSRTGRVEDSEKIVAMLVHTCPQFPAVPTALLNLSKAYLKAGISDKGEKCLQLLCRKYPSSVESQIAQGLLKPTA